MWMWCLHKVDESKAPPATAGKSRAGECRNLQNLQNSQNLQNLQPLHSEDLGTVNGSTTRGPWGDGTWFRSDGWVELIESGPGQINRDLPESNWANSWSGGRKMFLIPDQLGEKKQISLEIQLRDCILVLNCLWRVNWNWGSVKTRKPWSGGF